MRRVNQAMQKVKTPFCALLGDDEFQLPSGLATSADILASNTEIVAAIGSCAGFNVNNQRVMGGDVYGYRPKVFSGNIPQRIEDFFLHYSPTMCYALWRSEQLKVAIRLSTYMEWGSGNLWEWIQAFCGLCFGGHTIHGKLQWLRSDENQPQQAQLNRSISINQWWRDPIFQGERDFLIQQLEIFVQATLRCDLQFASALIRVAFECTVLSERHGNSLQILGLKPLKKFLPRNYKTLLVEVLKASCASRAGAKEIEKIIQSISDSYSPL